MNKSIGYVLAVASLMSGAAYAAAPADAPAGTMGICKDGTYSTSAEKSGACSGHKGVKEWYGAAAAPTGERAQVPAPVATPAPPVSTAKPTTNTPSERTTSATLPQPAPGGGAGKVWANSSSKVYHCSGDKYYGTTKAGSYMSEADAKAKGYHADHGKACG